MKSKWIKNSASLFVNRVFDLLTNSVAESSLVKFGFDPVAKVPALQVSILPVSFMDLRPVIFDRASNWLVSTPPMTA